MNMIDIDKYVKILNTTKPKYFSDRVIGKNGFIQKISGNEYGVKIDSMYNAASTTGVYWFRRNELEILEDYFKNESEDINMENFKHVAIVNLLEDYNKKDYAFALYEEDAKFMFELANNRLNEKLVVVNARGSNKRALGTVKEVLTIEDYYSIDTNKGRRITAEVVGVVNMDGYIFREEEKTRIKELALKKAAIEKELENEINKRKSVEYYEEMAKKYSDNPKLAELVSQLKELGE